MTAQLLLLFAVTAPAQPEWIGTMAWVTGEVQIDRGGNTYAGQQAAGVAYGDTFRTESRGRTAIYLFDGAVVMLGAGTHVSLKRSDDGDPEWFVERGEARVTAGDATRMIVHSRHAEALVHRTILRINVGQELDHYLVEHGHVHVSTTHDRQLISLGQGVHATADGVIRHAAAQPHRWAVRPAAYRQKAEELLRTPGADKQVDPFADEDTSTDSNVAGDIGPDDNGPDDNGADDNGADDNGADDNGADDNGADDNGADDNGSENHGADNNDDRRLDDGIPEDDAADDSLDADPNDPALDDFAEPDAFDEPNTFDDSPGDRGPADATGSEGATSRGDETAGSNQIANTPGGSLTLGALSTAGFAGFASGGLFSDAAQNTDEGQLSTAYNGLVAGDPFPGNIHLVTAQNNYSFSDISLMSTELDGIFPTGPTGSRLAYWSIGEGTAPTTQVATDFLTGTNITPTTIDVPRFGVYVIRLDQYGIPDPADDPTAANNNIGLAGLLGNPPIASPLVFGADPLEDERSEINDRATFALGEIRLSENGDSIDLSIRRSDQDRTIVKDGGGDDALDVVTVNTQVAEFNDVADPRFLPAAPLVKVPQSGAFDGRPNRFADLNLVRRAAVTTLMADQLHDFARRTGQTRFVMREADGRRKIIDISGYQRP